jgi:2-dehydropantoate 2-reductase
VRVHLTAERADQIAPGHWRQVRGWPPLVSAPGGEGGEPTPFACGLRRHGRRLIGVEIDGEGLLAVVGDVVGLDAGEAVLAAEADRGTSLPVDLHVGEARDAHQVDVGGSEVDAGDGDGLHRLVQSAGTDDLHLDSTVLADDTRDGASHRVGVRPAGYLENFHLSLREESSLAGFDESLIVSCPNLGFSNPEVIGDDDTVRFIVFGAGGVGGVIGGRLFQHGYDVVLIARGEHHDAIRARGLHLEDCAGTAVVDIAVVDHPERVDVGPDDVVLLTMKSQDTAAALQALAAHAPAGTPVVCAQNGVANERAALRHFANVYGICVMCPTAFLVPGVVQATSHPISGILDVGRHPAGVDDVAQAVAAALRASTFSSEAVPDITRWKYSKLLMNLANAAQAALEPAAHASVASSAVREGVACLRAAGIDFASKEEDAARRGNLLTEQRIRGERRGGGSSWQSLARRTGAIETDYLNGEIVMLGRLHGVPTPVNAALQLVANRMARERKAPSSLPEADFLRVVEAAG